MGSNRIEGIGAGMMAQETGIDFVKRQEEAAEVMFADMISMSSAMNMDYSSAEPAEEAIRTVKTEEPKDTYEKYQYKDKTISAKTEKNDSRKPEEAETEIQEFEEAITEVITEELQVSKEELEAVMEELGLTYLDLLDNNHLGNLIAKLTDCEDIGQLLFHNSFLNILNEVKVLGGELLNHLQMTPEEFVEFQQIFEQVLEENGEVLGHTDGNVMTENVFEMPEAGEETLVLDDLGKWSSIKTEGAVIAAETAEEAVVTEQETEQTVVSALSEETFADDVQTEEKILSVQTEEQMEYSEESMSDEEQEQGFAKPNHQSLNTVQISQANEQIVQGDTQAASFANQLGEFEPVQTLPPQVTVSEIMKQFAEQTRVLISADSTRMEMQLNPEHLGKLYLEIVESEGVITAKLQTQNTEVKEALEAQIADLKVNLSQAGVKVDSVEVTIASHEFERNLEQDANSQKQQEEAKNQTTRHRNINLNELDELSGIMSEEEALVARMMTEQGNSVDFTA